MNHQGTKSLESNRLLLRRFKIADASEMYYKWASYQPSCKPMMQLKTNDK